MAKRKSSEASLQQEEFDLRAMENLRRGFAAEGAWDWVVRADAIIAEHRARIAKMQQRL